VSGQGLRHLRAGRPRQRARCDGRRRRARLDRELLRPVAGPGIRGDGVVRAADCHPGGASDRSPRETGVRMRDWALLAAGVTLFALLPLLGGNYALRLGTIFAMYAVLALSWNIIGGLAGYPSFATAAFFGLGAYASAILAGKSVPMLLAWAAAGIVA